MFISIYGFSLCSGPQKYLRSKQLKFDSDSVSHMAARILRNIYVQQMNSCNEEQRGSHR